MTKVINLSELSHIVTPDLAPRKLFGIVAVGDVLDAEVQRVDRGQGVHLKLENKLKAFVTVSSVQYFIIYFIICLC